MTKKNILSATALSLLAVTAAHAQSAQATATTDLNLRAGPGPNYEIVDVIAGDDKVDVAGCLDAANWCEVTYNGTAGWAYGDYLNTQVGGESVVLYENRQAADVQIITYEGDGDAAAGGAVAGGAAGALVGSLLGPVGTAVGAAVGADIGADAAVSDSAVTYVVENEREPVYLEGEVVVGAGIPQEVELYEVPESDYMYQYVNGVPVIVEPQERRIIRIVRQ